MEAMRLHFAELLADIGFLRCTRRRSGMRPTPSGRYGIEELGAVIGESSKNESNLQLLRAVLCAGMFPNVANISIGKQRASFLTLQDGSVRPHPCSVNGAERFFPHRWLVYTEKVHTSGIFFRSSTMVTDIAMLLFGGVLEKEDDNGRFSMLKGHYLFQAKPEVAQMIMDLRAELQTLLEKKVRNPLIDLDTEGGTIVAAVMSLLENECDAYKRDHQGQLQDSQGATVTPEGSEASMDGGVEDHEAFVLAA